MTRAELRRRAELAASAQAPVAEAVTTPAPKPAVPTRRRVRAAEAPLLVSDIVSADVADLADLDPEALALPVIETPRVTVEIDVPHPTSAADVPVVEAFVAAADPSPGLLPTSPTTLPAPTRRVRARPTREVDDEGDTFELSTPDDASNGPIDVAAAAADEALAAEDDAEDARARRVIDEFEAAAKLFAFTGTTPVQQVADAEPQHPLDHSRRRVLSFKRVAAASFSVGVFGVVGLMAVGMTTPVGAVAAAQGVDAATSTQVLAGPEVSGGTEKIQAYVAPAEVQSGPLDRSDGFEAASLADIAAESGISNFSSFFVNDPTAAIQWPFAVGVPITYGFGMRSGTLHEGADFVPGAGSPVQAIADGTVRIATESGGAFGVTVVIDHIIDGELVSSRYAHMQYDSLTVSPGDTVAVGTVIGKTGNTGRSYGAHTHFEILAGGTTAIDPIEWMRAHTSG